jgi:hypothetical protein
MRFRVTLVLFGLLSACDKNPDCALGCQGESKANVLPDQKYLDWLGGSDTVQFTNGRVNITYESDRNIRLSAGGLAMFDKPTKKECGKCYDYVTLFGLARTYRATTNKLILSYNLARQGHNPISGALEALDFPHYLEIDMGSSVMENSASSGGYNWDLMLDGLFSPKSLTCSASFELNYTLQGKQYDSVYIFTRSTRGNYIEPEVLYFRKGIGVLGYKLSNGELWWKE